jgi:hypothetical protein
MTNDQNPMNDHCLVMLEKLTSDPAPLAQAFPYWPLEIPWSLNIGLSSLVGHWNLEPGHS